MADRGQGSGSGGTSTLPAGHTYTPINETTVIDENGTTYYVGPDNASALQQIAAVAAAHPDWVQVDETHWRTPGNIIHELKADANGKPILGGAWTAADSKAFLAGKGQTPAPSSGGGGGSASTPKLTKAQQAVADAYAQDPVAAAQFFGQNPADLKAYFTPAKTSTAKPKAGAYYGFDTPEQAQAYAASIANATPEQLGALQYVAQQSGGSGGSSGGGTNAYDQQISQANLDLAYAKMTFDEKQQAAQLQYQYMNAGLDANSARKQALATLIANKNNNATNVAQLSADSAKTAAQFAANPRDAVSEINYRNAMGMTATPFGSTNNAAFGTYQTGLDNSFQQMFGGAAADLQKARDQRDQPIPDEFSTPISVTAPQLPTSTYTAPRLGTPAAPPPAAGQPPAAPNPYTPQAPAAPDPWAAFRNRSPEEIAQFNAAYNPKPAAPADPWAAFRAMTPEQLAAFNAAYNPPQYAKGGTINVNKRRSTGNITGIGEFATGGTVNMLPVQYAMPTAPSQLAPIGSPVANLPWMSPTGTPDHSLPTAGPPAIMGSNNAVLGPLGGGIPDHSLPMGGPPAKLGSDTAMGIAAPRPWEMMTHRAPTAFDFRTLPRGTMYPDAPTGFHPPRQFAEGGDIGQIQDGYRPSSSSGGTNMNIHELAVIVGVKSGHTYATLGEHGYPEQIKITPTKEGKEYAQRLDAQKKAQNKSANDQVQQFDQGGTVSMGEDFLNGIRQQLKGIDPQAQAVGGQALPDPRLLAAGVYQRAYGQNPDSDLRGYLEAAYSKQGISPESLQYSLRQFQPAGLSGTSVRYA